VYHLTDLPSFVSTTKLVYFDPQAKYLPDVNPLNPGKMIDFVKHSTLLDKHRNQFLPYVAFGSNMRDNFNGTIFRLPLRTPAQAESSRISSVSHSSESIHNLLSDFQQEASSTLIFLKVIK
jgi:sacsin